jgi:lantibiotic modifying enzyme
MAAHNTSVEVERFLSNILATVCRDAELRSFRSATPMSVPVDLPGLMTGLAGIGLGLLRHADPSRVPSVLLLQSPVPEPVQVPRRVD